MLLFMFARLGNFGTALAGDPRYIEDLFVVACLALPFAWLPARGQPEPESALTASRKWPHTPFPYVWQLPGIGVITASAMLVGSFAIGAQSHDSEARTYVPTARQSLEHVGDTPVLDQNVPPHVMAPLFLEDASASVVMGGTGLNINWNGSGAEMLALDDRGEIHDVSLGVASSSAPGPNGQCGWAVSVQPIAVTLDRDLFAWPWIAKLEYVAAADTTISARLDRDLSKPVTVGLTKGLNTVWFVVTGGGKKIELTSNAGVGVCLASLELGQAVNDG